MTSKWCVTDFGDYSVTAVNGIIVTRDSYTQITVSGVPEADASITLTAATAKTKPDVPEAPDKADCSIESNDDGRLIGVTDQMEYKKSDASVWTAGTGSDIKGLSPGTYYASSDKAVAVVTKGGKIKARKAGSCTVYVYAVNGYAKKIRVNVK